MNDYESLEAQECINEETREVIRFAVERARGLASFGAGAGVFSILHQIVTEANLWVCEEPKNFEDYLRESGLIDDELDQVDDAIHDGLWYEVETTCGTEYLPEDIVDCCVQYPIAERGGANESDVDDWEEAIVVPLRDHLKGTQTGGLTLLPGFCVESDGAWVFFGEVDEAREYVRDRIANEKEARAAREAAEQARQRKEDAQRAREENLAYARQVGSQGRALIKAATDNTGTWRVPLDLGRRFLANRSK